LLRQTAAHNVVMIDGQEQLNVNPELLAWHTGPQADFSSGRIARDGISHQRSVLFVKPGYWVVVDHIAGAGEHEVTRLFHFPAASGVVTDGAGAHTEFASGMNIRVQPMDAAKVELRTGLLSGGDKAFVTEAPVAALVAKGKLPMTLGTVLLPYAEANELPKVRVVKSADPQIIRFRLEFPNGQRDEIAIASESKELVIGAQQAKTRALCVRQGPVANEIISIPDGIGAATSAP
ncbi:MAG TPA: heparinase II/III family protein, partial [bacterium]|nr:heparinase II/III family protein [bacterium]